MTLTLKYDVLRTVIILQTLSTAPAVMAIVGALRLPEADVIPMVWQQTQDDWDNGRPWLSAARQKKIYYISYTKHGWTAYEGFLARPELAETNEKKWIDNVRMGYGDIEGAAIPTNKRPDNSHHGLDYMSLVAKQLGCNMSELYILMEHGEIKTCISPGCEQRIKKATEFYATKNKCKQCMKRERNTK